MEGASVGTGLSEKKVENKDGESFQLAEKEKKNL